MELTRIPAKGYVGKSGRYKIYWSGFQQSARNEPIGQWMAHHGPRQAFSVNVRGEGHSLPGLSEVRDGLVELLRMIGTNSLATS